MTNNPFNPGDYLDVRMKDLGTKLQKNFGATPLTLGQNATPNILIVISDKETLMIF